MTDKEEQEELPSQPLDGEEGSGTCLEICDEEETQESLSSPPKSGPGEGGTELPTFGNKCSCVMCFSKDVPRDPEGRTESMQADDMLDTVDLGNNSTVRKPKKRRKKERTFLDKKTKEKCTSKSPRQQQNCWPTGPTWKEGENESAETCQDQEEKERQTPLYS